jgi:hypothetical protein
MTHQVRSFYLTTFVEGTSFSYLALEPSLSTQHFVEDSYTLTLLKTVTAHPLRWGTIYKE